MQEAGDREAAYRGAAPPHNQAADEATGSAIAHPGGPHCSGAQSAFFLSSGRETIRVSRIPELPLYTAPMSYMGELRKLVGHRPLFSVGVSVVLQDERGWWLLQRRSDSGLWGVPGGGLEPGETFEAAAARELQEETGLIGVPLSEMMTLSGPQLHHVYSNGDVSDEVSLLYRAHGVTGTVALQPGKKLEWSWFARGRLPEPKDLNGPLIRATLDVAAGL